MNCNNMLFKNNLVLKAVSCVHFSVFCYEVSIGCWVWLVFTNTCLVGVCLHYGFILHEFLVLFSVNVQMIGFEFWLVPFSIKIMKWEKQIL